MPEHVGRQLDARGGRTAHRETGAHVECGVAGAAGVPQARRGRPSLIEAVNWLDETVDDRRQLALEYPSTRIAGDEDPPSRNQQASAFYDDAIKMMKTDEHRFDGQMLLKGIIMRWLDTEFAEKAGDELRVDLAWKQREFATLMEYSIHRCRGFDRFATEEKHEMYMGERIPRLQRAIQGWGAIIQNNGSQEIVSEARERVKVLSAKLDELQEEERKADGK